MVKVLVPAFQLKLLIPPLLKAKSDEFVMEEVRSVLKVRVLPKLKLSMLSRELGV